MYVLGDSGQGPNLFDRKLFAVIFSLLGTKPIVLLIWFVIINNESIDKKLRGVFFCVVDFSGDADNRVILKLRLADSILMSSTDYSWQRTVTVHRASRGDELSVKYISLEWGNSHWCKADPVQNTADSFLYNVHEAITRSFLKTRWFSFSGWTVFIVFLSIFFEIYLWFHERLCKYLDQQFLENIRAGKISFLVSVCVFR